MLQLLSSFLLGCVRVRNFNSIHYGIMHVQLNRNALIATKVLKYSFRGKEYDVFLSTRDGILIMVLRKCLNAMRII